MPLPVYLNPRQIATRLTQRDKLLEAVKSQLAHIEGEQGDPRAYGMPLSDPDHPYHDMAQELRDLICECEGK